MYFTYIYSKFLYFGFSQHAPPPHFSIDTRDVSSQKPGKDLVVSFTVSVNET
jgi:hypothetical protein